MTPNRNAVCSLITGKSLLSGFFMLLLFHSCDIGSNEAKVDKMLSDSLLGERAENVEMRFSDSGKLKVVLFANSLERYNSKEPYTVFDQGVTGYFYGPNGKVENSVKSKYAISYDRKKEVVLKNDVQLVNVKKEKLNTEKLIWDQNTGRIYTDEFVKITTPENIIYGEGFEADQDFNEYKIFKVKGEISLDEKNQ